MGPPTTSRALNFKESCSRSGTHASKNTERALPRNTHSNLRMHSRGCGSSGQYVPVRDERREDGDVSAARTTAAAPAPAPAPRSRIAVSALAARLRSGSIPNCEPILNQSKRLRSCASRNIACLQSTQRRTHAVGSLARGPSRSRPPLPTPPPTPSACVRQSITDPRQRTAAIMRVSTTSAQYTSAREHARPRALV
jgi:hypothetical protein